MLNLQGKTVAIVGLARSGQAAARLCARHGARVLASDAAPVSALNDTLALLKDVLAEVETGEHTIGFLARADLIVVSPGVPLAHPVVHAVAEKGVPLIAEVELASHWIDCPIVGVTGSNGKTTTTSLTGEMLTASGHRVFVGGNIGTSLCELPLSDRPCDVAVVELSSFQLEAIDEFKVRAAAVLNITADHLDRYLTFEAYAAAKMNLLAHVETDGVAVCNGRDAETRTRCAKVEARTLWFGDPERPGAVPEDDGFFIEDWRGRSRYCLERFALVGEHNRENAMAAALLARHAGATDAGIQQALDTFSPLDHRLEPVRQINGVRIVNDSKATAPASVGTALASFTAPVVLLMGGRNKGGEFGDLSDRIASHARAVFTFGEAGPTIVDQIVADVPVRFAGTMDEAVAKGFAACRPGDVLLLSPGCASFDAFNDYIHRGERFKELVREL